MDELEKPGLLDHLPSIYHGEAEREGSSLRALLFIFDHIFSSIEREIDEIDKYFTPSLAPATAEKDFLSWLSSWVALRLDEAWSEEKKRHLIRNAAEIYRYRGTPQGLKYMIGQFFGMEVEIKEWSWPQGMEIGRFSAIGVDTFLVDKPALKHCFEVIWRPSSRDIKPELIKKVRAMIDLERPVHTKCYLRLEYPKEELIERPKMTIGISSIIGSFYID